MERKALVCMVSLLLLFCSNVQAQDLCDKYFSKYEACVEMKNTGRSVDYVECAGIPIQIGCELSGCTWDSTKNVCKMDMCLSDSTFDGKVDLIDLVLMKTEFNRTNSTYKPTIAGYMGAPVEKTGKTTSYRYGDDGDLERGVAWPNPRFTIQYYGGTAPGPYLPCNSPDVECDNPANPNNDVVFDNLTGLYWLRNADYFGGTKTWDDAVDSAQSIPFASCGGSGWRLPNVKELQSLIDFQYFDPAISNAAGTGQWFQGDPFVNVQSIYYWSSTSWFFGNRAWFIDPVGGITSISVDKNDPFYVWPVCGGQ